MKDLNKLTKAEREAREKRLEYNRRYDAMKKAGTWQPKEGARATSSKKSKDVVVETTSANVYQQINAAIDSVKQHELALEASKQALRDLLASVK